ncbi:hypothetical protein TcasGA2_TC014484 [Tribolium castaneum]|uniref:Uncharacterized protein n=1 Tax=Tribolium castaneum TaxID=7070 RepID=D6WM72_TRICA|nr:hypothetical protein TcasGA2_TC014484 [Tribolium castaneum]
MTLVDGIQKRANNFTKHPIYRVTQRQILRTQLNIEGLKGRQLLLIIALPSKPIRQGSLFPSPTINHYLSIKLEIADKQQPSTDYHIEREIINQKLNATTTGTHQFQHHGVVFNYRTTPAGCLRLGPRLKAIRTSGFSTIEKLITRPVLTHFPPQFFRVGGKGDQQLWEAITKFTSNVREDYSCDCMSQGRLAQFRAICVRVYLLDESRNKFVRDVIELIAVVEKRNDSYSFREKRKKSFPFSLFFNFQPPITAKPLELSRNGKIEDNRNKKLYKKA